MKVKVMSRKEALPHPFVEGDHLIAIRAVSVERGEYAPTVEVTHVVFNDDETSMTMAQAVTIYRAAGRCRMMNGNLYVHCDAGISRSAGVAEALHRIGEAVWDDRDAQVWQANGRKGPRYMPNAHVVSLMIRAAGATP